VGDTQRDGFGRRVTAVLLVVFGVGAMIATGAVVTHLMRSLEAGASPTTRAPAETAAVQRVATPVSAQVVHDGDVVHADLYFDVKSTRLRADAVRILQEQAARMDGGTGWTVLVQGYADRRGAAEYNRLLAQRRADAVKRFLSELGVPDGSMHTVTIGPDGALCDDPSPECQQLNRRVHLEIRKLGPAAAAVPVTVGREDLFQTAPGGSVAPEAGQ
jgi:outer membrane protein OmpA-like peptidoglycan-associated protein